MDNLDKEYQFFKEKKDELLAEYENKFVVIRGQKVIASYDDKMEAIEETKKSYELGTFLVQHVTKEDEVAFFHSRAFIKNARSA